MLTGRHPPRCTASQSDEHVRRVGELRPILARLEMSTKWDSGTGAAATVLSRNGSSGNQHWSTGLQNGEGRQCRAPLSGHSEIMLLAVSGQTSSGSPTQATADNGTSQLTASLFAPDFYTA
jgi:hypothetical protein